MFETIGHFWPEGPERPLSEGGWLPKKTFRPHTSHPNPKTPGSAQTSDPSSGELRQAKENQSRGRKKEQRNTQEGKANQKRASEIEPQS